MTDSRLAGALLAVVLFALSGCGGPVPGSAVPDERVERPLTSAALGDLRTLDPCGLADAGDFAEYGSARPLARESLDYCRLAVSLGRENVVVDFGLLRPADLLPEERREVRTLPRGLRVLQTSDSAEMPCELEVLLADEMAISVLARPQNSDSELGVEQLCVVAHAGADGIARTLRAGEVEHWEPPHNSLVRLSACALLPPGVVAAKAGVAAGDVTLYPAEHQCTWGSLGGEEPNVQLDFVTAVQPPGDMAEDIAGRPSSVREATTSSVATCTVSTEQIEFARAVGGEREFAVVRLLFPASMGGEPCPVARELAEIAWGKLPPA